MPWIQQFKPQSLIIKDTLKIFPLKTAHIHRCFIQTCDDEEERSQALRYSASLPHQQKGPPQVYVQHSPSSNIRSGFMYEIGSNNTISCTAKCLNELAGFVCTSTLSLQWKEILLWAKEKNSLLCFLTLRAKLPSASLPPNAVFVLLTKSHSSVCPDFPLSAWSHHPGYSPSSFSKFVSEERLQVQGESEAFPKLVEKSQKSTGFRWEFVSSCSMMMFHTECYLISLGEFQRKKHRPCKVLVPGHLKSNRLSLLTIIVISVQNNKLHHRVPAFLYPAHLTVRFAERT